MMGTGTGKVTSRGAAKPDDPVFNEGWLITLPQSDSRWSIASMHRKTERGAVIMMCQDESSQSEQDQSGSSDPVLCWMVENGLPLTREAYLNVAYMGNPPKELGPEQEAELPEQFQKWGIRKRRS
jgi:hypothetical protein